MRWKPGDRADPSANGALGLQVQSAELLAILRSSGLVSDRQIVDEGLILVSDSRRNDSTVVKVGGHPTYFVKQAPADSFDSAITLARERRFYDWVIDSEPPWKANVPRCEQSLSLPDALITEAVTERRTLNDLLWSDELDETLEQVAEQVEQLGAITRRIHATEPSGYLEESSQEDEVPWVLGLDCPHAGLLCHASLSDLEALMLVQQHEQLLGLMRKLQLRWQLDVMIHGDFRTENILVDQANGCAPVVLDWEFVGWGLRAWDIGCFFADLAAFWAWSATATPTGEPSDGSGTATHHELARSLARRFWGGYCGGERAGAQPGGEDALLAHAYDVVPVRLVQLAVEVGRRSEQLEASALLLLQLAANLAEAPVERGMLLLGLAGRTSLTGKA